MSKSRFSRQSFLGQDSQEIIERAVIGVVGLGGGGSHIVQQLAHIGFLHYIIFDPDHVEESNLNRLVGATEQDFLDQRLKIEVADRVIKGLRPKAEIKAYADRWQNNPERLRECDIVFGCVDGFAQRRELEICTRRYLIPYIDIGMDVHCIEGNPPRMGGQIILSMPGSPCMFCLGFLNERVLTQEAARYGDAGENPQVVWPNGVLASTAVGICINLLTDWTQSLRGPVYFEYDGNLGIVKPHPHLEYLESDQCIHYSVEDVGDPIFKAL